MLRQQLQLLLVLTGGFQRQKTLRNFRTAARVLQIVQQGLGRQRRGRYPLLLRGSSPLFPMAEPFAFLPYSVGQIRKDGKYLYTIQFHN